MNGDKEGRLIRYMKAISHLADRAHYDMITMARFIARLADKDARGQVPDHAEEIIALMDRCDKVIKFHLNQLDALLRLVTENGMDMPETRKFIYQVENLRKDIQDLRLDITLWVREFEDEPSEAERLEMMISLPTPEKEAAEKAEAFRTGGASLLK